MREAKGRVRVGLGGGDPFKEVAVANEQTPEGAEDGVKVHPGTVGHQNQIDEELTAPEDEIPCNFAQMVPPMEGSAPQDQVLEEGYIRRKGYP
jgi:hypothetical protein